MLNFIGIGAQKCGTSWLSNTLSEHPKVAFPGKKGVHFWDQHRNRGIEWYTEHFSSNQYINGDFTPAYGFLPVEVIREIYELMPNLRLFYMIRNPIDRAWSSARMALGRSEMLHEEASDQWFVDHFNSKGSISRGDYETCLRQWRSVFPEEQLLLIRYENIITDPVGVGNKCLNHIGLENFYSSADIGKLSNKVFKGDDVPLRASLLPVLQEIYQNRIESLEKYLNEDLTDWKSYSL